MADDKENISKLKEQIKELNDQLEVFKSIPLNIYQKLQKSRVELQNKKLRKTGINKYSNFEYFELGDFLPAINEICNENGLATIFHFSKEEAKLTIIDTDNLDNKLEFTTPVDVVEIKNASTLQKIGGTQTYCRRYLYIMAFEIAEHDSVDSAEIDTDKEQGKQYIDKAAVFVINKLLADTKTEIAKFLEWAEVDKVEHIPNSMLASCMKELKDKKAKIEKAQEIKQKENIIPEKIDF